jgi:hypothetical protein
MSDKILSEEELEIETYKSDYIKENIIAKHMSDIQVMSKLIESINEYLIVFGRTSNVHDQLIDLKAQVKKNRDHLNDWINKI